MNANMQETFAVQISSLLHRHESLKLTFLKEAKAALIFGG